MFLPLRPRTLSHGLILGTWKAGGCGDGVVTLKKTGILSGCMAQSLRPKSDHDSVLQQIKQHNLDHPPKGLEKGESLM